MLYRPVGRFKDFCRIVGMEVRDARDQRWWAEPKVSAENLAMLEKMIIVV